MLQGKCPKCRHDLKLPSDKATILCVFCGQEIAVKDAADQIELIDSNLMDEKEYREEFEEACRLLPAMLEFEGADERFKKETYGDAFKEYYTAHYRTMMKVEKVFTASQKQEYVIEQLTEAFLNATEENIQALPKNEQTKQQTHYNFMMAVYALPVMARYKGPAMDSLADSLVEEWNQRYQDAKISQSTFEKVNRSFRNRLCYITTAVCESLSKGDDCYELQTLRDYRDGYLLSSAEGINLIQEYYDIAPTIVKHINRRTEAKIIYQNIYEQYLCPCIRKIEQKDLAGCRFIYEEMVHSLKKQYMIEKENCAND